MFSNLGRFFVILATSSLIFASNLCADFNNLIYLSKIKDENGKLLSRSLLEFHLEGTVSITDSAQQGAATFVPFSTENGLWELSNGANTLTIKTVDFSYPKFFTVDHPTGSTDKQQIVTFNAELTRISGTNKYQGDIYLNFFPLGATINNKSQAVAGPIFAGNMVITPLRFQNL